MSIHVLILTWGHIWVTWRAPGVPVDEQRLCVGGVVIRCAHRGDKMVVALVLEVALQSTDLVRWLVTRIGQRRCKVRYLGWSDHNCLLRGTRYQSLPHHLLIWTWLDSVSLDLVLGEQVSTLVQQLISHVLECLDLALTINVGHVDIFFADLFITRSLLDQEVNVLWLHFLLGLDDRLDALLLKYALAHLKQLKLPSESLDEVIIALEHLSKKLQILFLIRTVILWLALTRGRLLGDSRGKETHKGVKNATLIWI